MATVQDELRQTRESLDRYKTSVGARLQNLSDEIAMLRASLENAGQLSEQDQATFDAMQAELDAAAAEAGGTPTGGGTGDTGGGATPPADTGNGGTTGGGDTGTGDGDVPLQGEPTGDGVARGLSRR